ncbi:MAG: RecQ family ATP-dependent DNA helicase [Bacteroidetes bacterium]|nr:RecQ family ATP-dependent DNA helicase [Bacteroidota bacterium]
MQTYSFDEALQALQQHFGYPAFRPGQDSIIQAVLERRNVLAVMPTGGGKSICYQIPAVLFDGLTIVVSPLISLMQDQVASLERARIRATLINSSLEYSEVMARLDRARNGWYKLMYVAPERFESRTFVERMKGIRIAMFAVDEAHCISEWGHDFRPSYTRLREAIAALGSPQTVALTATATPDVRHDIQQQLELRDPKVIVRGFNRENLTFRVMLGANKRDEVLRIAEGDDCGIVYAGTRNTVEELAIMLRSHGMPAEAYHAGLQKDERKDVQQRFMESRTRVIVATTAFGMGIDKSDVRFVVHHDMPSTLEQYYQEAGRAGRDGAESVCTLLYHPKDRGLPEFFIRNTYPDRMLIQKVYAQLHHFAGNQLGQMFEGLVALTASSLASMIGNVSETAVRGALDVLERDGYIRRINESYNGSTIRFLLSPDRMRMWLIESAMPDVQPAATALLRTVGATAFYDPVLFSLDEMASKSGYKLDDLMPALRRLHEDEIIDFTPGRKGTGIALLGQRVPAQDLAIDYAAIEKRMRHQLEKLRAVEHYITGSACRRNMILEYFDEDTISGVCGKCDTCTSTVIDLGNETSEDHFDRYHALVLHCAAETGGRFGRTTLADVLRGAETKRIAQFRLFEASSYGKMKSVDKRLVFDTIDALLALGWLAQSASLRPSIYITEAGRAHLGYEVQQLRLPTGAQTEVPQVKDPVLFEALKAARRRIAASLNIPSHTLVSDAVIVRISDARPRTREEMLGVEGMGPVTFEKCGKELLAAVEDHLHDESLAKGMAREKDALRDLPAPVRNTWELASRGLTLADIAVRRGLTEGTVSNHISELLQHGVRLNLDPLVPKAHQEQIRGAVRRLRDTNLKKIKGVIDADISFAEIRIMLAVIEHEKRS